MDSPTPPPCGGHPRTPPLWGGYPTTDGEAQAADADAVNRAAAAGGLPIPEACLPGVMLNLALLARHAAVLDAP